MHTHHYVQNTSEYSTDPESPTGRSHVHYAPGRTWVHSPRLSGLYGPRFHPLPRSGAAHRDRPSSGWHRWVLSVAPRQDRPDGSTAWFGGKPIAARAPARAIRSEERRVGKECRYRWS